MRDLGVTAETLGAHGAVSEETVAAMARGALARSEGQLAIAVSGVAGPDGGSVDKPVGTVWLAVAREVNGHIELRTELQQLDGDRDEVRRASVFRALELAVEFIQ
jgi:nicotinamide-nucleotide amidase